MRRFSQELISRAVSPRRCARVSRPRTKGKWLGPETGHNRGAPAAGRRGVSLMEVMVVLIVIGVLISMSAPTFHRSIEQSWADIAGANLRAIWCAQRLYWLENRAYTSDLSELESLDLIDPTVVAGTSRYGYAISAADSGTFTAAATRTGSTRWTGQFTIDESGALSGAVQAAGQPDLVPGFQ